MLALAVAVVISISGLRLARLNRVTTAGGLYMGGSQTSYYDQQLEAAATMEKSAEVLREVRVEKGIPIDPSVDPNRTGLIGDEFTSITTSMGVLEAKRTATNPAFAAMMVKYFHEAGLRPGDVVAVGSSGSFPSLILATLSAAKAMDLEPIIIYSVGASMYGANIPEFTFVDMLGVLSDEGILPYDFAAVSLGGDGDSGRGVIFEDGQHVMEEIARRSGAPLIREKSVAESVARRLEVFRDEAAGRPIGCFVNIGGASANYGSTPSSLSFPNGLVLRPPVMPTDPERGLIFEFAAQGIPVINLLDVRGLAIKNGLPVDPIPLPEIGQGGVYYHTSYSKPVVAVSLATAGLVVALSASSRRRRVQ